MSELVHDSEAQSAHAAFLYASTDEFVDGALGFLAEGLDEDEAVLVTAPGPELSLLKARMNGRSHQVTWADTSRAGTNPGRLIPHLRDFASAHAGRMVRCLQGLGWAARNGAEQCEAIRHEALINLAFAAAPVRILCTYDSAGLDPGIIKAAGSTHPVLIRAGQAGPSSAYNAGRIPDECDGPLPAPPAAAATLAYRDDLAAPRAYAAQQAARAGLSPDRVLDLVLAVGELVGNTFRHTRSGGVLSLWPAGDELVCQLQDSGHITDPLAGRRRPGADAGSGHGLWVVHQVCDLVEVRSRTDGTVIRMHMRLDSGRTAA